MPVRRNNYKVCQFLVQDGDDFFCQPPKGKSRSLVCRTICKYPSLFGGRGIMKREGVLVEF